MSATCEHCAGTGSLSKDIEGSLDCGYCNIATERVALENWALEEKLGCSVTALWKVYQYARQVDVGYEVWQFGDGGWITVDKDCYDRTRPEDRRRIIALDD